MKVEGSTFNHAIYYILLKYARLSTLLVDSNKHDALSYELSQVNEELATIFREVRTRASRSAVIIGGVPF